MRNIKKMVAALTMAGIIILSTSFANAGIIVAGAKGDAPGKASSTQQCSDPSSTGRINAGIVVAGLTGIVVAGFTGIIVVGAVDSPITTCGIVVAG